MPRSSLASGTSILPARSETKALNLSFRKPRIARLSGIHSHRGYGFRARGLRPRPGKTSQNSVPYPSMLEEAPEQLRARRMLELPQRLRLDLADALARHRELLADLLERVVGVETDPETHAQDALLARVERGQHARRGLAQAR